MRQPPDHAPGELRRRRRVNVTSVQNPLRLSEGYEPQTDLVLLGEREGRTGTPRPEDVLLLIEVSDTTLRYDREVKLPLYARTGIPA